LAGCPKTTAALTSQGARTLSVERTREMATAAKKSSVPKNLGEMIDYIAGLQVEREALMTQVKEKETLISAAMAHLESNFDKASLDGARGKRGVAERRPSIVPKVVDWDLFWKYVYRKKAFDLTYKRVAAEAYRARLDNNETVDGVEPLEVFHTRVKLIKGK
jgi:hypothetical protein